MKLEITKHEAEKLLKDVLERFIDLLYVSPLYLYTEDGRYFFRRYYSSDYEGAIRFLERIGIAKMEDGAYSTPMRIEVKIREETVKESFERQAQEKGNSLSKITGKLDTDIDPEELD